MVFALVKHASLITHQRTCLYATDTYGSYAMTGSWSDNETHAFPAYDGNGSGDDYYGTIYHPSFGWQNNTDGGRSTRFPDYRQA
mmetsp:Transcript_18392/g.42597  ORF Transcript_18392/g.42597 Transcript_18392/m.42597 type:complete len:84 (+) Transcript_18392:43-294(+)